MSNQVCYTKITERILEELDKGQVPWKQSWSGMPRNYFSKREYNGINCLMLMALNHGKSCEWATFHQISEHGYKVNRGAKGIPIVFAKSVSITESEDKTDEESEDEELTEPTRARTFSLLRYYYVFNISDTNIPLPKKETTELPDCEKIANELLAKLGIITLKGNSCSYCIKEDYIILPPKENFDSSEEYYVCLFHEIIHATGKRLGREMNLNIRNEAHCKEELIAEIGATFLAGYCGIENVIIKNSVSYIKGWRDAISQDKKLVISAASKAQQAVDWLLGKVKVDDSENREYLLTERR